MSRRQIGLRMKDETRDQLERVRGGLSRTDYIEGAVLAQIARDLKKTEPKDFDTPDCSPFEKPVIMTGYPLDVNEQRAVDKSIERIDAEEVQNVLQDDGADDLRLSIIEEYHAHKTTDIPTQTILSPGRVRSSAESKSGVLPVPKKAVKGRK